MYNEVQIGIEVGESICANEIVRDVAMNEFISVNRMSKEGL